MGGGTRVNFVALESPDLALEFWATLGVGSASGLTDSLDKFEVALVGVLTE